MLRSGQTERLESIRDNSRWESHYEGIGRGMLRIDHSCTRKMQPFAPLHSRLASGR